MEKSDIRKLRKAIDANVESVKTLFQEAKKLQDTIPTLTDDSDRKVMEQRFSDVADAINRLMRSTTRLFEKLEEIADDSE